MANSGLTPIWQSIPVPTVDPAGDLATQRGSDPSIDGGGGASGLNPVWDAAPVSPMSGEETGNSVSGLPMRPSRFAPSEAPPEPPGLTDRNPGTIDEQ